MCAKVAPLYTFNGIQLLIKKIAAFNSLPIYNFLSFWSFFFLFLFFSILQDKPHVC
jgi:hypothetical protein